VKPAYALDGDDATREDPLARDCDQIDARYAGAIRPMNSHARPALGAGDAFGVESSVMRLAVFGLTRVAEGEVGHRGPFAVVRQRADDRKPRATGRTRLQGMPVSPIVGIDQLGDALVAQGAVRNW
jgi:hypothetical protein